jgi:hypothetical protein
MMDKEQFSAEQHWDDLAANNPSLAQAFAAALGRVGVPLAKFLGHTNSALTEALRDPAATANYVGRQLSGPSVAGEQRSVPDSVIREAADNAALRDLEMDDYVQARQPPKTGRAVR